jgi:hypothetical protein
MPADKTSGRKRTIGITLGGVATVLTLWYALPGQPVQAALCENIPSSWNLSPRLCASEFRTVDPNVAEDLVDTFLTRASGAQPKNAYNMMSETLRAKSKGFIKEWEPILFADRLEPLRPVKQGQNRFTLTYVTYNGEGQDVAPPNGRVNTYTAEIGLTIVGADIEITVFEPPNRLNGERTPYYQEVPGEWAKTYDHPQRLPDDVAAPRVEPQQRLSLLCQVQDRDGTWWSRTGWGWIAHADLTEGEGKRAVVPMCSSHQAR